MKFVGALPSYNRASIDDLNFNIRFFKGQCQSSTTYYGRSTLDIAHTHCMEPIFKDNLLVRGLCQYLDNTEDFSLPERWTTVDHLGSLKGLERFRGYFNEGEGCGELVGSVHALSERTRGSITDYKYKCLSDTSTNGSLQFIQERCKSDCPSPPLRALCDYLNDGQLDEPEIVADWLEEDISLLSKGFPFGSYCHFFIHKFLDFINSPQ